MKLSKRDQEFLDNHLKEKKTLKVVSSLTLSEELHGKSEVQAKREAKVFMMSDSLAKRLKR